MVQNSFDYTSLVCGALWKSLGSTDSDTRIRLVKIFLIEQGFNLWEPKFHWQNKFIRLWFRSPFSQPEVWWETVVASTNEFSGKARASGRTTMLALLLAVEDCLPPNHELDFTQFPDHYPTQFATHLLELEARKLQEAWRNHIGQT